MGCYDLTDPRYDQTRVMGGIEQELGRVRGIACSQFDELKRLRAAVSKLPKTVDGVPIYEGMFFWDLNNTQFEIHWYSQEIGADKPIVHAWPMKNGKRSGESCQIGLNKAYSSREAVAVVRAGMEAGRKADSDSLRAAVIGGA